MAVLESVGTDTETRTRKEGLHILRIRLRRVYV